MGLPPKILIALIVLVLGGFAAWYLAYPTYTHRYRLTVEVDVDGQTRTGSSVIEVRWNAQPAFDIDIPWSSQIKGQAPLVDLDRYGVLLAALSSGNFPGVSADFLALRAFGFFSNRPRSFPPDKEGLRKLSSHEGKTVLREDNLPLFVWLTDRQDPNTAKPLRGDEVSKAIAPDVRLRGATIEMTRDAVTTNLARELSWLRAKYEDEKRHGTSSRYGEFKLHATTLNQGLDP